MRTVFAVLAGVLVHFLVLSVVVSQTVTLQVVQEGAAPLPDENPLVSWVILACMFVVAALVGGTAAGAVSKGRFALASCLVGAWGAMLLFANGQSAADLAFTVVLAGAVLCVPAALLGGYTWKRFCAKPTG